MAGTGGAQVITLASTPVLTRIYSPADFGLYAAVFGAASIIATASCLRYEAAIPMYKDSGDPEALLMICIASLLVFTGATFFAEIVSGGLFGLGDGAVEGGVGLLAALVLMCGMNNSVTFWTIQKERFSLLSLAVLLQSIGTVGSQILLFENVGTLGLLIGAIIGYLLSNLLLLFKITCRDKPWSNFRGVVSRVKDVAIKYRSFPLFGVWAVLLNNLNNHLPNILFFRLTTPATAGIFSMSTRMTRAPLALIGQSVFQVMSQHTGQLVREGKDLTTTAAIVTRRMAHLIGLPLAVASIFFEELFSIVLGAEWGIAGSYAKILAPWIFLIYISWPLTAVYNSLGLQRSLLVFNILFVLGVILSFSLRMFTDQSLAIVIGLSVFGSGFRLLYCAWIYRYLSKSEAKRS